MNRLGRVETTYLWGIKILIYFIPFLPLLITPSMVFPYITGKNFAFRILVEVAAALWLALITTNKYYRTSNSILSLSILVFTFIVGLADLLGVHPDNSFWSNCERMEGYITILHLALYFIIVKSVLRTRKEWGILFSIFLVVSVFVALFAFILPLDDSSLSIKRFVVEYGTRAFSTIGNPPFLASYLLLSIFIGLILIINTRKTYHKVVCLLSIGFNVVVIYLTGSRGAILAGISGIILSVLLFIRGKNISLKKLAILFIICTFILVAVFLLTFNYSDFLKHDRTISRFAKMFSDPSVKSRIDVWEMALKGIKTRPILGWGQENFVGLYSVNPIPLAEQQIWMDRAHNIIIHWLVTAGSLGFFAYLAIFIAALYIIWVAYHKHKIKKIEANVLGIALFVYFIQNLFIFDTVNTYLIFFTILAYIDNLESLEKPIYSKSQYDINTKNKIIKPIGVTLSLFMIFPFVFYYLNYLPIRQCQMSIRISNSFSENDSISILLDDINNVQPPNTFGRTEWTQIMISVSNHILLNGFINEPGAVKFIQATTEQVMKGLANNLHNLEYLSQTVSLYYNIAQFTPSFIEATESLIRECIRINPDFEWPYMVMTDIYILKKDYERAVNNAKNIMERDPHNDLKHMKLAIAATYLSREDVVSSSLDQAKKIRMAKNPDIVSGKDTVFSIFELKQLAQGYKEAENYQKALQYLKEIINVLSFNGRRHKPLRKAQIHIEIARIYQKLGERNNAAIEAKKAAILAPAIYEEEAKNFID